MTAADIVVADGPLIGSATRRLPSSIVGDYDPAFPGVWHSALPRPRFGDEVWEISGTDPTGDRPSWLIDFSEMRPQWSLLAREVLYIRANQRRFRDRVVWLPLETGDRFKAGTIMQWRYTLMILGELADELGIGLPDGWGERETEALRDVVRERFPNTRFGAMVNTLYRMRSALTLGGPRFDPTKDLGIAEWSGDTSTSRVLATKAMDPETFRAVVCDALTYVEQCATDILKAVAWLKAWKAVPSPNSLPKDHPVRLVHTDVTGGRSLRLHEAIERIGGIPTSTVRKRTGSAADVGEPCGSTLLLVARLFHNTGSHTTNATPWIARRVEAGAGTVPGGLPVAISEVTRADGTTGPWRPPFCAQSIGVEAQTLQDACKIVIMAFTAMRDSELSGIPRTGWRTTWHGADAITTPLIKNARGEPMKWWATPAVIRACEILESLADPSSEYLFRQLPMLSHRAVVLRGDAYSRQDGTTRANSSGRSGGAANWRAVQDFVQRINTDGLLLGFLPIPAGWSGSRGAKDEALPKIHPRAFRFTLASISNFVALGDVAFQKQAKHALLAVTHSYAANGGTDSWRDLLTAVTDRQATDRLTKAADLYQKEWAGEQSLAGHAGRDLTRTIRDLLDRLPVQDYNADADESQVEQFATQVREVPELAAAIRSTAVMLYPGTLNHCLRYVPQMECTDKAEPMQGLCRPETCGNVLLEPEQQQIFRYRLNEVDQWLGMPRIPAVQKEILGRRRRHLEAQLQTERG